MKTTSTLWPAPAKLNLFLHVTGQRADGYHELQTVFQFLEYGDSFRFHLSDDLDIMRSCPLTGVDEAHDLTLRAARLLQQHTGVRKGVEIELDKFLPMGGGLGGGSSDAATVLVALNYLWDTRLSLDELADLGLVLGADVPVFVRGQAAWAEGVGEQLKPIELPEPWFLVINPAVNVSTAEVFSDPALKRDSSPITIASFLAGDGRNDCENVVFEHYPEVAEAYEWLNGHAPARMTGTGSCLFACFEEQVQAKEVLAQLPDKWQGFVARGLNQSPLHSLLQQLEAGR